MVYAKLLINNYYTEKIDAGNIADEALSYILIINQRCPINFTTRKSTYHED